MNRRSRTAIPTPVPMALTVERLAFRVEEAAEALGLGRDSVFKLLREGRLRSVMVGSRRLIPVAAVHEFLAGPQVA